MRQLFDISDSVIGLVIELWMRLVPTIQLTNPTTLFPFSIQQNQHECITLDSS